MHRSESTESSLCVDCGAEISPSRDRGHPIASDSFLCFECAVRRGGRWDEVHDRWAEPADVTGLVAPEG